MKCPYCSSDNLLELDAKLPHHKKLICGNCEKFIKWIAHPVNLEKTKRLLNDLRELKTKNLTNWQKIFISDMLTTCEYRLSQGKPLHLSPKQSEKLAEIQMKVSYE